MYSVIVSFGVFVSLSFPISIDKGILGAYATISNKGEWKNCFSKFSNLVLPPIFIYTILQSVRKENLVHYFPYDVKLGLLAHSRSFLANQNARNAIVGAENFLIHYLKIHKLHTCKGQILGYCLNSKDACESPVACD